VKYRIGQSEKVLKNGHYFISVLQFGQPDHKGQVCGNQVRGFKRAQIAEMCLNTSSRQIYQKLAQKHLNDIEEFGNCSNVPTKGKL